MKKIIKYFVNVFISALIIIMSASRWNVNAEEPMEEDPGRLKEIEDIINDNSPLTDEQILWVKQYLSQYVDENIVRTIVSIISALAIIGVIAFSLIKLVKDSQWWFEA